MEKNVLNIVEEDILEALARKNEKILISLVEPEIKVSRFFISKAIEELEKDGLIKTEKGLVFLSEKGVKRAKDIIKKHSVIENYFKKLKSREDAWKAASILEHYVSEEVIENIRKLSTLKREGVPLPENKLPNKGMISDVDIGDYRLFERIISMGIFPGEKIKIVAMLSNSIVVVIGNKKFALDRNIANRIKVIKR